MTNSQPQRYSFDLDFCSGGEAKSPDTTVYTMMEASGFAEDDILYEAARYYATVRSLQCRLFSRSQDFLSTSRLLILTLPPRPVALVAMRCEGPLDLSS